MNRSGERSKSKVQPDGQECLVLNALPAAVIVTASDGTILYMNPYFEEHFGPIEHQNILSLYDDPAERELILGMLQKQGSVTRYELRVRKPAGCRGWVLISVRPYEFFGEPALLSTLMDITPLKEAEEQFRKSDERYQSFLAQSFETIYCTEFDQPIDISLPVEQQIDLIYANAYIAECNQAFARMHGVDTVAEILGFRMSEAQGTQDNSCNRAVLQSFIEANYHAVNDETREYRKDGKSVWLLNNRMGVVQDGFLVRLWGTAIEITERKREAARLEKDVFRGKLLLELYEKAPVFSDKELYDFVLGQSVQLTDSAIGFFHLVSDDQKSIILTSWNEAALKSCTANYDSHYPLAEAGNWVDCVREKRPIVYNDFDKSPNQRGLPDGHTKIKRILTIPVLDEGKVKIIFGVGNKPEAYDDVDILQIQLVVNELYKIIRQRRSDLALQKSEEKFSKAFYSSQMAIAITGLTDGCILDANQSFEELSGYSRAELIGSNTLELKLWLSLDDRERVTQELSVSGATKSQEFKFRKKDGSFMIGSMSAELLEIDGERCVLFDIMDVTSRRQTEEKLEHQIERLSVLYDIDRAVASLVDLNVILSLLVKKIVNQLHLDASAVLLFNAQTQTLDFAARQGFLTDALQFTRLRLGGGWAGRVAQSREIVYIANLAELNTNTDLSRAIADENFVSYIGIPLSTKDTLLGVLEIFHRSILEPAPDWLAFLQTLADRAAIAMENARLLEITRQSLNEISALYRINQGLLATVNPEELMDDVVNLLQANFGYYYVQIFVVEPATGDFVMRAGSGELGMRLKRQGYRLAAGDGIVGLTAETDKPFFTNNVEQVISFMRPPFLPDTKSELAVPIKIGAQFLGLLDIHQTAPAYLTDRDVQLVSAVAEQLAVVLQKVALYEELQESLSQEHQIRSQLIHSEKLAVAGRLLASVSHELNNPIQAIQNALFLLKEEQGLSAQGKQDFEIVLSETERMAAMLQRLRTTYQPINLEDFRPIQLNDIIEDICALISTHLRHSQISFAYHADPALPAIYCIENQVRQVILNLFINAVDAMPDGGNLTISTQFIAEDKEVLITVIDTGVGINTSIFPNIFDPFVTSKEGGTGLGLSISYEIVLKHHGRIQAKNNPDKGATFNIWLPMDSMGI